MTRFITLCILIAGITSLLFLGCSDRSTDVKTNVTVSGTVIDPTTERGIPDASVAIIDAENGDVLARTTTGDDGYFRVEQLPRVRMYALIEADGFSVTDRMVFDPQDSGIRPMEMRIVLTGDNEDPCCTGVLTVTVIDVSNNPVEGATVRVWKKGKLIKSAVSGADGKAVVGDLCAGEYAADVTKDGYGEKEFHFGINSSCDPVSKTVELPPAPCCTGVLTLTVLDVTNNPVPDATVKIRKGEKVVKTLTTDASGQVIATDLCGGKYSAVVSKSGFTTKDFSFTINENCDPVTKTLTLEPGPCCTGIFTLTVKDKNGNPIADATVKVKKAEGIVATGTTNASGVFTVNDLCGGEYHFWVIKSGYVTKESGFVINSNCDPVTKEIVLETGPCCSGTLTLTVRDINANPVQGATVKVWHKGAIVRTETTDANGQAVIDNLCVGEYGVDVTKDGYEHKEFGFKINVNCDPVAKDVTLETGPCCTGTLTLTVKDKNANPVEGATVKIWSKGAVIKTVTTDANGQVVVTDLCAGEYGVDVKKDGVGEKEFGFKINSNCDPVTKEIILDAGPCCTGTLTLTVKDKNANPIEGATVKIWSKGAVIKTVTTDANGQVVVTDLCAGEYAVDVKKDGYAEKEFGFKITENCDPVTKDIVLEPAPCCTGVFTLTVTDANNTPIADAAVKLKKGGTVVATGKTDASGKFVADNLCAGEYVVLVSKEGYNAKDFAFLINQNCDPVTKEMILETGPCCTGVLTVTVTDAANNPIAGATVKIYKGGSLLKSGTTDAAGIAVIDGLCKGEYGANVIKDGYNNKEFSFGINANCDPVSKSVILIQ